jgi:crotonobetainyl-CoA:carnitine CoA-transferase CaiB-like acyl-CoA transferase
LTAEEEIVPDPKSPAPPLRVLDLTDELAFQGARLLVGLGADVLRVDSGADSGGPLEPAEAIHWHAGKRWLRLPTGAEGERALDELAAAADVVLESGPVASLRGVRPGPVSRWPRAVHVVVTPFGLTGPRRHWLADDLVLAAAGGMAWLGGRADGPPKPPPAEQAVQLAGAHAAIGALLGVLARDRTGDGELVDISGQEAVAATLETAAISWIHAGRFPARNGGVYEHVAHRIFAGADGYVAGGYSGSNRMWTDLLAWLVAEGEAGDLVEERWQDPVTRWQGRPHVDEVVGRFVAKRAVREIAEQGRARALPWAEVVPAARLAENPQLRERRFFVTVTGAGLPEGGVRDVGFPWAAPARPRPVTLPALRETSTPWTYPTARGDRPDRPGAPVGGALTGVRVLDLTWVLAGPYATKALAEHGAEVIKVESRHRQDPTRFAPSMRLRPDAGPDDSGYFLNFNRGKRGIALNLRTEAGQRVLRDLVAHCDVVVENFSPGVLSRWGMDYDSLRTRNPEVILVSMAGVGQTGPWRDAVTFADTLAAMSGLSSATADPGGPPQGLTFGLGDMVAANAAVLAVLDLLAAGRGGLVDLSQLEAMASTMGPAMLGDALPNMQPDQRTPQWPSRSARMVPHGVYPAEGADRWVAIAALDDAQWRALVAQVGLAELDVLRDADLATRRAREDEIDAALAGWTRGQDAAVLAARLQEAGVAASLVATGRDLVDADEQLAARDFYPVLTHPIAGPVQHEGIVARLSATPGRLTAPAPLLGEHTEAVLRGLLGMDDRQLAALAEAGALE